MPSVTTLTAFVSPRRSLVDVSIWPMAGAPVAEIIATLLTVGLSIPTSGGAISSESRMSLACLLEPVE